MSTFGFGRPSLAEAAAASGRVTVSPRTMRQAITDALRVYSLADLRVVLPDELHLTWGQDDVKPEDAEYKKHLVEGYTEGYSLAELAALGRIVHDTGVPDIANLEQQLAAYDAGRGVETPTKNLIFAANGPKPKLVLVDALTNDIKITRNAEFCLIYDRPTGPEGLHMSHLISWWREQTDLPETATDREVAVDLYYRLRASLGGNHVELAVFDAYQKRYKSGFDVPALVPQVYLHYDPYTAKQRSRHAEPQSLPRERMDFLLLFSDRQRVVIEVDGQQHYADADGRASTKRYAEMVAEDRRLRLAGYEVYRFGGYELQDPRRAEEMLDKFFEDLAPRAK